MSGEENKDAREKEEAKLEAACDAVLQTDAGKVVFEYLFNICGYNKMGHVADPRTGELFPTSTAHNEARRGVYISMRRWCDPELLSKVEVAAEKKQREIPKQKEDK